MSLGAQLVRSGGPNGRRLDAEELLASGLRALASEFTANGHRSNGQQPSLRFEWVDITKLSFAEEIRLLRRTRVFVSLFGSSLHNCRWLPAEAVVVEIHGALKHDWRDSGYVRAIAALRWSMRADALCVRHLPYRSYCECV